MTRQVDRERIVGKSASFDMPQPPGSTTDDLVEWAQQVDVALRYISQYAPLAIQGGGYRGDLPVLTLSENDSQDINAAATDNVVDWNVEVDNDDVDAFRYAAGRDAGVVTVLRGGPLLVSAMLTARATSSAYQGEIKVSVNGTALSRRSVIGEGVALSTGIYQEVIRVKPNDQVRILVDRVTNTSSVPLEAGESALSLAFLSVT